MAMPLDATFWEGEEGVVVVRQMGMGQDPWIPWQAVVEEGTVVPWVVVDLAQAEEELEAVLQTYLGGVQLDLALQLPHYHPHLDVSLPLWSHTAPRLHPHSSGIGHLLHCCRRALSCSCFVHPYCDLCKKTRTSGRHGCSHLTFHRG